MKRNTQHIVDEWLVASAQAGDEGAFSQLVQRWSPKLLGYARSQLQDVDHAQDAVQDTLIVVSKELVKLRDPTAFPKWVYLVLQRRCVDIVRLKQGQRKLESHLLGNQQ